MPTASRNDEVDDDDDNDDDGDGDDDTFCYGSLLETFQALN